MNCRPNILLENVCFFLKEISFTKIEKVDSFSKLEDDKDYFNFDCIKNDRLEGSLDYR